jgi:hypothetical protein
MSQPDQAPLEGTLADAEAAMRKGRATQLWIVGALGIAVGIALVLLVGKDDEARVYGEIGKRVNGINRGRFDQFWACALQTDNVADIHSNAELSAKLDARGDERGKPYGVHLRERCLPNLEKIAPELETLIVPSDLQPDVTALLEANGRLRGSVSEYVAYLDDPELDYDPVVARPVLGRVARAWYDFKKAHGAINTKVKAKLK